ncbi:carboxymuconolactone decarboxylase family protein [Aquabacter spiritensis]|uniref:Putative peroxidase-related enzyme n=1 Tax=Aquabacter spiritensis TaxID=933073 RepID=A0A4R3LVW8_9HYPH|nr:carboxymuconolactone decarboxylase family protein [Aquabacter spiritensis]TCT04732.1 putative peroxidase-related enzyme [Aquabacter spiritensis]
MSRLPMLPRDQLGELEPLFARVEQQGGTVPNAWRMMAHVPDILRAFTDLAYVTLRVERQVPPVLKWLVAHVASRAAGCNYCMLHAVANADGLPQAAGEREKIDAVWEFETSPLFTEAERTALRVALGAALVPNAVTDADFEALKAHYTTEQIVEIVAVIALFGFLNRWNDTLQSELEEKPLAYAASHDLDKRGWSLGAHGKSEPA